MTHHQSNCKMSPMKYAVVEIAGRQYLIHPNISFLVNHLGDKKEIGAQVLLLANENQVELGMPYLKEKLNLNVLEVVKGKKIRVAKYHAKANTRKVRGSTPLFSRVQLNKKA